MSELQADCHYSPTNEVVKDIQSHLSKFVSNPEYYDLEQIDTTEFSDDTFGVSFEGIGQVLVCYQRQRSHRQVSFKAEKGFEVNTGFRVIAGITSEPIPLSYDRRGSLNIRYQAPHESEISTYYPVFWMDGGCSFHAVGKRTLHWQTVSYIGSIVGMLPKPPEKPKDLNLSSLTND